MGYSPRGHKESDKTERLTLFTSLFHIQLFKFRGLQSSFQFLLFLAVLGLRFLARLSLVVESGGYSSFMQASHFISMASFVVEHGF